MEGLDAWRLHSGEEEQTASTACLLICVEGYFVAVVTGEEQTDRATI